MTETLTLDRKRPGIVALQLNRPKQLNAINQVMRDELLQTFADIATDASVNVVVLSGAGRGFCSGIDMRNFGPDALEATDPAIDRLRFQEAMAALPQAIWNLPQPVIAAVNGPCVGAGLALCLASDIRICSAAATFGNAAILLGLSGAEMGMSYHLPRIVGTSVAADWMLTGRTVSADEADRRGLVSELVEPDRLADRAMEIASTDRRVVAAWCATDQACAAGQYRCRGTRRGDGSREPKPSAQPRHRRRRRSTAEVVVDERSREEQTAAVSGPLHGVRIVTMGGLGPGPFCGMLLGDLGADVVRVDMPRAVDGPLPIDYTVRRSQRSIALDVKEAAGRAILLRLVESAEAFIEVFRPGVAERLGIGPDDLLEVNPRLVYARMTGYGQDGPYADRAGHDINYIALAGALNGIGTADAPVPPLNLVGDYGGGGMLLAVGLLSAILDARASQQGQVVDVAMVDGAATLMTPYYGMVAAGTWRDHRHANVLDGAAHYYGVYETADDKHVAVGAMEPQFYAELCQRLGVEVPHDENDPTAWDAHRAVLAAAVPREDPREWERQLSSPGCCAAPVLSLTEAPQHPHNVARGTFIEIDGVVQPAPAPRFSRTHARRRQPVPRCPVITPARCLPASGWTTKPSPG